MNISLDFDDTYTRDVFLWARFILEALGRGHKIYIVTSRGKDMGNEDIEEMCAMLNLDVYYTNGENKREYMLHQGISIDVWIDDCPECV